MNILSVLGHGGVDNRDTRNAKRLFKIFSKLRLLVLIYLIIQWYFELKGFISVHGSWYGNMLVWIYFLTELSIQLAASSMRKSYLANNWTVLAICIFGVQLLFYPETLGEYFKDGLRLLLVVWLIIPWLEVCFDSLSDNYLITTIITVLSIITFSGIIISGLDPNIETALDGIWWAWVTVTTVGYGDVVPVSAVGRAFGFGLILVGLLLFSVLTANFSALFTKRRLQRGITSVKKDDVEIKKMVEDIKASQVDPAKLMKAINRLERKINNIEKELRKSKQ